VSFDDVIAELPKLSVAERQELRRQLARLDGDGWIDADDPLTDAEKALLDARLEAYAIDPDAGSTWGEVEARLKARLKA
jgi:putative addiction module component (TIGR02574 family)